MSLVVAGHMVSMDSGAARGRLFFQNICHCFFENYQLVFDHIPNDFGIHAKVLVDEDVSQSRDPPPINFGMLGTHIFRHTLHRFPDDLQVANDGVECLVGMLEGLDLGCTTGPRGWLREYLRG